MRSARNIVPSLASVGILVGGSMLVGCDLGPRPIPMESFVVDRVEPAEMRSYQVPQEYQNDLRDMLQDALGRGDDRVGRVTEGPGGTLLVVAPERIQAGFQQILDAGFEASPASSPITLTYWLLVGRPVTVSAGAPSYSVAGTRDLQQLEPVLTQLATAQGPTEFTLLEVIELTATSQSSAGAQGRFTQVEQTATRTGSQVVANVDISIRTGNRFRSQVTLDVGQFLVLGQAGLRSSGMLSDFLPDASCQEMLTLYYVISADVEP